MAGAAAIAYRTSDNLGLQKFSGGKALKWRAKILQARSHSQTMADKPIEWVGSAKEDLMDFPDDARRKAGFELRSIQQGDMPSDFKPMPIVGKGVEEIRIRTENTYRIFCH